LSTVKNADKIIVIEDGQVTEEGDHNRLIEQGGLYADLWRVQSGDIEKVSEEFVRKASSDDIDKIENLNPDEE
jgi:ATP-binding cassette subfamily B protein